MIDFKQKIEEDEKRELKNIIKTKNIEESLEKPKKKWMTTYTIILIVIALIFTSKIMATSFDSDYSFMGNFFNSIKHLVPISNKNLQGEKNDRINILLLGIGNNSHAGAYLTDTIILVSLQPSTKKISLISIPRDLAVPVNEWKKINSIDAYAESKNPGKGAEITTQKISTLLNIPIQYYLRLDFNAFVNIINNLGGIDINVANTLDDYTYPLADQENNPDYYARFEHLHISKGWQKMDGSLALKYVRSRHAFGIEGSDFARAHRQQLVLEAIKNKLISAKILLNPVIITRTVKELDKDISTNLNPWEILRMWNMFKNINHSQIIGRVLSDSPDSFLIAGRAQNGAYILTPRTGNFNEIQNFVKNIFKTENKPIAIIASPTITDQAKVIILNGTWISGLASKNAILLKQAKFNVLKIANAPDRNNKETLVYDLSSGSKKFSLKILEQITGAKESFNKPLWIKDYEFKNQSISTESLENNASSSINFKKNNKLPTASNKTLSPDFIVVLGTNSNKAE